MMTALLTTREVSFSDFEFITSTRRAADPMEAIFNDVAAEVAEFFQFAAVA
jgi:hypothetical protein